MRSDARKRLEDNPPVADGWNPYNRGFADALNWVLDMIDRETEDDAPVARTPRERIEFEKDWDRRFTEAQERRAALVETEAVK